jgi:hypothetical protein
LGSINDIFGVRIDGSNGFRFSFNAVDRLDCYNESSGSINARLITEQNFRDPSAWYHIVLAIDTTNAIAGNRMRLYINGSEVTVFDTDTQPSQNTDTQINTTNSHVLGFFSVATANLYMTEVNFIDGQALTATSFGYVSPTTGIWSPAKYVGGYGTNGFYLNFSDNSNTTAATLGKDYSGNGNNWTPNNFSVTAGAGNDSLVDSPTSFGTDTGVGGTVRGNYATFNPLIKVVSQPTFTDGNLLSTAPAGWSSAVGTIGVTSGKWYWEIVNGNSDAFVGICGDNATLGTDAPQSSTGTILYYGNTGNKRIDTVDTAYGSAFSTQTIGVALDIDGGTIVFYRDNVSQGSISLSSSTLNGKTIFPLSGVISTTATVNFGQRPFVYTAPSGFKALCTQNLPTPTIGATSATLASKFFAPALYTGNDATQVVNVGFQPDFVWIKPRTTASYAHKLFDSVRGATKYLDTTDTGGEGTVSGLTSFDAGGFTVGSYAGTNSSSYTFVAWNWKASNASAVTNTSGSITSSVSANPTAGFSIVTYTGTGSAGATVGHGLGAVPSMIIFKRRTGVSDWQTYHTSLGNAASVYLNLNNASAASPGMLNSTTPTSTLITLGTSTDTNPSAGTMVAHCFAEVEGYSKIGSYTGNGNASGTFVYMGFRPRFFLLKRTTSEAWIIADSSRDPYNVAQNYILANTSGAEAAGVLYDFVSNGIKFRGNSQNESASTYIYMAFAESPFKYSLAR